MGGTQKIYKSFLNFLGGAKVVGCSKSRDIKTEKRFALNGFKVYAEMI
jgi:ribose-phosphate pyrophosphokinase